MANVYDDDNDKSYWKHASRSSTAEQLKQSELPHSTTAGIQPDQGGEADKVGKGYVGKWPSSGTPGKKTGMMGKLNKKRKIMVAVLGLLGVGIGGGIFSIFGVLNTFQIEHLLNNVDKTAFLRYEVRMDGRTRKYVAAYMRMRLAEIEDPSLKPGERGSLFRATELDKTDPTYVWYKLMRGSQFEDDLLKRHGIKFTSMASFDAESKIMRIRPAVIRLDTKNISFALSEAEEAALKKGQIKGVSERLTKFIEVEVLDNDKVARKLIGEAVDQNTRWYQVLKRFYLRKSIQRMTGVRDWRFFENTRNAIDDKVLSVRNKLFARILPESTVQGKFLQCVFGISNCRTTTDPNNPLNKATSTIPEAEACLTPGTPGCKTSKLSNEMADGQVEKAVNKGTVSEAIEEGVEAVSDDAAKKLLGEAGEEVGEKALMKNAIFTKTVISKLLNKVAVVTLVLDVVDIMSKIDELMSSHVLSAAIYMARAQQAISLYREMGTMRDQLRTGEVTAKEVNEAMQIVSGAGNSEGWDLINKSNRSVVAAASLQPTKEEAEYCSPAHQEAMLLPENEKVARDEYHWLCDYEKIGGTTSENVSRGVEDVWKGLMKSQGWDKVFEVYRKSGADWVYDKVSGFIGDVLMAVVKPVLGWLQSGFSFIVTTLGVQDDINSQLAAAVAWFAKILGVAPTIYENSPGGVYTNHVLMGAVASAEFEMRNQGAPLTTPETAAQARRDVALYKAEQWDSSSIHNRYLALSNPNSVLARGAFAIINGGIRSTVVSTLGNLLSGAMFVRVSAADDDVYAAAKFSGVETYDFPNECLEQDPLAMTPQSSTNADEFNIIPAAELTWEFVTDADAFNAKLYENVKDYQAQELIKRVYNCALLDSSVRGGLGGLYDNKTLGINAYGNAGAR